MINVNEIKRNAKNIVKKYSDAQVKVREATSNDPWGPSSTIMAEIADLTYNVVAFSEIMQMIWKRINDHGKNWRHVFKSLVLLEYLIKTGNEKVSQQCIENIFAIQTLKDFQYIEDNKDNGISIREKSKKLVALLKDPERLKAERSRALKAKSRAVEAVSSSGKSSFGSSMSRSSSGSGDGTSNGNTTTTTTTTNNGTSGYINKKNKSGIYQAGSSDSDTAAVLATDINSARPQSLTEEETQLQIALALSKEEAERQDLTRKNDELRLKLALDASKQAAVVSSSGSNDFLDDFSGSSASMASGSSQQQKHQQQANQSTARPAKQSNIDDLLGLSFTPTIDCTAQQSTSKPIDILGDLRPSSSSFISSIPSRLEPQNDPWSSDPWQPLAASQAPIQSSPSALSTVTSSTNPVPNPTLLTTVTTLPTNANSVPDAFSPMNDNLFSSGPRKPLSKNPFED